MVGFHGHCRCHLNRVLQWWLGRNRSRGTVQHRLLNGNAPLRWVISDAPLHSLPIEVFMRQYYTPKLLAKIMAGASLPGIRNIAEINQLQPKVGQPSVEPDPGNPELFGFASGSANRSRANEPAASRTFTFSGRASWSQSKRPGDGRVDRMV